MASIGMLPEVRLRFRSCLDVSQNTLELQFSDDEFIKFFKIVLFRLSYDIVSFVSKLFVLCPKMNGVCFLILPICVLTFSN